MRRYDAVIFDLDGTLLDTSEGISGSVGYVIKTLGLEPVSNEVMRSFIGPPIQKSFARVYGLSEDEADNAADLFRARYKDHDLLLARPYDGIIEAAIRAHNAYILEDDPDERRLMFCKIIRDADKIDIFRVNDAFPKEVVYDTTKEILAKSPVTDEVVEASLTHNTVHRNLKKTPADTIVGHLSLVYGIYYPESIRMLKEQGYLQKLMETRNENEDTNSKLSKVCDEVRRYMDNFKNDL